MKNMRKLFAMVLAVMMVMSLATTAFATGTYTITINGTAGHSYEVYQIFAGDLKSETVDGVTKQVLSNIVWGNGVTAEGRSELGDAAAKAETLTNDNVKTFAAEVSEYLTNPKAMTADGATYTLTNLDAGYYLIKDANNSQEGDYGTYTAFMLRVVDNVTATPKDSVPGVEKTITGVGDIGDYNIGDDVPFTLTATLGSNLDQYEKYYVQFVDTLSNGLTYNRDAVVKVNGTAVTEGVTVSNEGNNLTITIADAKVLGASDGNKITVEYSAKLNTNAVVGGEGNPNTVKLVYSNDPNVEYNGDPTTPPPTGETPEDTVVVFTFELRVTKVDGADNAIKLKDAEFKLKNAEGKWVTVNEDGKVTGWAAAEADGSVLKSDENGEFKISGLEDGDYYLKETKAPAGYNLLVGEIKVVIVSTYDAAGVKTLQVKVANGELKDGTPAEGWVAISVENKAGSTLPETGGMGTTMFYLFGGIMVLAAVTLLVTKKRMAV